MMSNDDRLVYMLNQIARNFAAGGPEAAARSTAEHVASFWDPRMRTRIKELQAVRPDDFGAVAQSALDMLARDATMGA